MAHITRRRFLKGAAAVGGATAIVGLPHVNRLALGEQPVKWGSMHPLTGPYAMEAIDQQAGVEIAIEEINAEGGVLGRKVELVVRDTEFNPAATKRKAVELLENEKVDFIAGSLVGFEEIALNELACKHGIIYANYPQHILDFKGKMCKYFFTANLTPFQIAKSAGIFATKQGWGKRWHMLGDNYSWPQMVLRGYEKVAKEVGADWTGVTWAPFPTQDYSAQIPKVQAVRPDVLFVTNFGADQVGFVKQAREFGLIKQMKIAVTTTEITMAEAVGRGGYEGVYTTMPWYWEDQTNPRAKKFVEAFFKKRNRAPMAYSGTAYTLVRLILDTANEIKSIDKDKLTRALEGKKFKYLKGEEQVRACDHTLITDIYFTVGKSAGEMKGKFDYFHVVQKLGGEQMLEPCEDKGWDPKKPASAQI